MITEGWQTLLLIVLTKLEKPKCKLVRNQKKNPTIFLKWVMGFLLVHAGAVMPNLALVSSLHPHSSKLSDSTHKSPPKSCIACCKLIHSRPWSCVCKQCLIRGEQTHTLLKILEVGIVKGLRRGRVHVNGNSWVHPCWAHLPQLQSIGCIECWVNSVLIAEPVDSLEEAAAMREPNCVCT